MDLFNFKADTSIEVNELKNLKVLSNKLMNMKKIKNDLVLRKDDYTLLISYLKIASLQKTFNRQDAENLGAELKKQHW